MRFTGLCASSALVSTLAALPALAVTPDEVWQNWQDLSASYGQTVATESVVQDGSDIVVTGLTITQSEEGATVESRIDQVTFGDNGDGTVRITMSDSVPVTMTFPDESGNPVTVGIKLDQPGLEIVASGDAAATRYDFTAPEVTLALDRVEGVEAEAVNLTAEAKIANLAGNYLFGGPAEARTLDSAFSADSLNLTVAGKDMDPSPAEGEAAGPSDMNFVLAVADLSGKSTGTILSPAMMADFQAALAAGFAATAEFVTGSTTYSLDVTDATGQTKLSGTGGSAAFNFAMADDTVTYGSSSKDVEMTFTVPEIPFPDMKLSFAEAAFNFKAPIAQTEEPADFAVLTKLVDLRIADEIWGMFDPGAVLPREPATVVIDAKGKAKVTSDLSNPEAMAEGAVPGELHALDVTEIRASLAGAELTGAGAFTFDNTDFVTFGGVPAPTGKLDLKLLGGNALMEKLVTLGVLSQEDVMGANMMLSMFANPGPGEDEFNSTLEFKDKGFFANGQRLQ